MDLRKRSLGFVLILVAGATVMAADSDTIRQLDEALTQVVTFNYGGDHNPLVKVEQIVFETAPDDPQRSAIEERLIKALDSPATTDAKSFLCRMLQTIGTARCVPALEKLLVDAKLSHMARYALGRMEEPAAEAALHRALGKTSGTIQIGIINTLGDRRSRRAAPDLAALLRSNDQDVAGAAAAALGQIGGSRVAAALKRARTAATKELGERIDGALLVCAERFIEDGQTDEAANIYRAFYAPDQSMHLRLAGLRGLVMTQPAQAVRLLSEAIRSDDVDFATAAVGFIPLVKGTEATKAFAALLASLSPETQELMVLALGEAGDAAAIDAIASAVKSEYETVRLAAFDALGNIGDPAAVRILASAAAAAQGRAKLVARAGLIRLPGRKAEAELVQLLVGGPAETRPEAARALAGRKVNSAIGPLVVAARDGEEVLRQEAIRALGILVGETQLEHLVELAVDPKDAKDRPAIEQAIAATLARVEDKEAQAKPLLDALGMAPAEAKPALLRLLAKPATPAALQAVRSALQSDDESIRDAAVRALSDWPDARVADDLLSVVRTSSNRTHKVLALRGYVRVAGTSDNPTAMYVRAMQLAERTDDKKLVLAGLGAAHSPDALAMVERFLDDPALHDEAALATVQIADRLRATDAGRAKGSLTALIGKTQSDTVRKRAHEIINDMEKYDGYILAWMLSGPYEVKGKDSKVVFDTAFAAEKPDASDVKWQKPKRVGSWDVNLEDTFGGKDQCAAYAKTAVWSPVDQNVRLELGSDDAIAVWLNGERIHQYYGSRGLSPRQDLVNAKLRKGWNPLLLKVVDQSGGWAFCCRIRKSDGSGIDGLKFDAAP